MGSALRIGFVRRQAWLNVIKMFELKLRRSLAVVKFVHMNAASRAAGIYHDGILHDRATPAIGIVHRRRITTPARERGVMVQLRRNSGAGGRSPVHRQTGERWYVPFLRVTQFGRCILEDGRHIRMQIEGYQHQQNQDRNAQEHYRLSRSDNARSPQKRGV